MTHPLLEVPDWIQDALNSQPSVLPDWAKHVQVRLLFVTPAVAQRWLERNTRNRRESASQQLRFVKLMELEEWRVTTDGVGFFHADGALENGQNRLHSVVTSGIGQWFVVAWGLPEESAEGQDQGRRRNAADLAGMMVPAGEKPNLRLMSTYRYLLIMRYVLAGSMASWADSRNGPTIHDQLDLYREVDLRPDFQFGQELWGRGEVRLLPAPLAGALFYILKEAAAEDASDQAAAEELVREFFRGVSKGIDQTNQLLHRDDPRLHLRAALLNSRKGYVKGGAEWEAAMTVKAWVFYKWRLRHPDDAPESLTWRASEPFPDPMAPPSRAFRQKHRRVLDQTTLV